ncbi:MAG TPA: GNAT family N-acetyltransferase [bacterium]|nr:GNAT family N-acetyltransferase [bacterium]
MIEYRELKSHEISRELFRQFNRYQKITRCWRTENGARVLKHMPSEENWNAEDFNVLVKYLKSTITTGGTVFGAFENGILAGFCSVENEPFGENKEYLQLSSIHVSCGHRGRGTGKELFRISADRAREMGAGKLYISSHSSEETQAFYKAMNCREATEYNRKLAEEAPSDCQLEYQL